MRIKLKEPRVYRGHKFAAGDVIEVAESLGARLILSGAGTRTSDAPSQADEEAPLTAKEVAAMNKSELLTVAEEHGIDLSGAKNNAERARAIIEALGV